MNSRVRNVKPLSRLDGRGVWGEGSYRQRSLLRTALLVTSLAATAMLTMHSGAMVNATPTPPPAQCTVVPRTPSEIVTLLEGTDIATPAATTSGATLPAGTPASENDRALMTLTVTAWLDCQNAGEQLRAWALFSDGYLYRLLSREAGLSEASLAKLATPTPTSAQPAVVDAITDKRQLPDGRLGASVTISYASIPMPKRFFFYFVREGDRLLIDSILGEISFSVP